MANGGERHGGPDFYGLDWQGDPPGIAAAGRGRQGSLSGVIETITTRSEPLPPPRFAAFRRALLTELVPLLLRLAIFCGVILAIYLTLVWITGNSLASISFREFLVVGLAVILLSLFRRSFGSLGAVIIGAFIGLVAGLSTSLRRIMELTFLGARQVQPRRDVTVYDITLLDPATNATHGVRMYGRLEGAPLVAGQRVTFRGVEGDGVFLAWGGENHAYGAGGRFRCSPPRR